MKYPDLVKHEFRRLYNDSPLLVRSPGRINLIGEHTDYNMGYVLPAAIDRAVYFAVGPRRDQRCTLHALDMNEQVQFTFEHLEHSNSGWPNYLMGVVDQLFRAGLSIPGFNCVFAGDIPIGAGLSSSAAIEAGLAFALNKIFALGLDSLSLVKLAQKAENEFVGVKCGIMDMYVNMFGSRNNVLRIDCRTLEHTLYPFDFPQTSIVLLDTGVSHSLASSQYNQRREECFEGVKIIRKRHAGVTHLRDVTMEMVEECKDAMNDPIYRRCKYVVGEDLRVLDSCKALERGDLQAFGTLLSETHVGLRDDFEVSCRELDYLVDLLKGEPHVFGSRMTGGGFGGCTLNIVENEDIERVCNMAAEKYKQKFNIDLKPFVISIGPGTSVIRESQQETANQRLNPA
ncbi:MAG: galactokinase [Bacteroidota bacterium]